MFKTQPLIALLTLSLLACGGPSQHDPVRYGTVRVGINQQLSDPNNLISRALDKLDALGPDFVLVNHGNFAAINIEPEPNPFREGSPCQRDLVYDTATRTVFIDPLCLSLSQPYHDSIVGAFAQLIARTAGMRTICRIDNGDPNCSEVGFGEAMMNSFPTSNLPETGFFRVSLSTLNRPITDLDLAEYRLHGRRL